MDTYLRELHLNAGKKAGRDSACGSKINYKSEETASKSAEAMMRKGSKALEPYPCPWCDGWHIGRKMSIEELESYVGE